MIILFLLFIFSVVNVNAATYFIKDGGNDGATGLSDTEAWGSFSNVASLGSGHTILLNRGDTFRQQLTIPSDDITIGAYGTGAKPIISGADLVSGSWIQSSGNIYYASVSGNVYQVFQNGNWVHLSHEPDGYWNWYETNFGTGTRWEVGETGDDMTYSSSQIAGGMLIGRVEQWMRNTYLVNYYDSGANIIYLVDDGRGDGEDTWFASSGEDYWLANKLLYLDSAKEWYHDSGSNRLYVYQDGGGSPTGTWEVTRRNYGIYASARDNLVVNDVEVRSALNGIGLYNCINFEIDNVDIENIGTQKYISGFSVDSNGIYIDGQSDYAGEGGIIHNSNFNNVLESSISGRDYNSVTIENNVITNSATVGEEDGFGPGGGSNMAIRPYFASESRNWIMRNNILDNIGYNGIVCARDSLVEGNTITNSMKYLGDGGAIYAGADSPCIIRNNYIETTGNGVAGGGYGNTKTGIYLDMMDSDCTVFNNTILDTQYCLFNHGGSRNVWQNNTCIDYTYAGFISTGMSSVISDLDVRYNRYTSSDFRLHVLLAAYSSASGVPHTDWSTPSLFNYNTYYPDKADGFEETYPGPWAQNYSFSGWQSQMQFDLNSQIFDWYSGCTPSWDCSSCTSWSSCIGGYERRNCTCIDLNACSPSYIQEEQNSCSNLSGDQLVLYYSMDSGDIGGGVVNDLSGNGFNGQINGNPSSVAGMRGEALQFDGVDDYLDTGLTDHLNSWTVIAWVRGDNAPGTAQSADFVSKHDNLIMTWDNMNSNFVAAAGLAVGGNWYPASFGSLSSGTWYHLAASYDGETLRSYMDGQPATQNPSPSGNPDVETATMKVARHAIDSYFFDGAIDELKVYNYVLADTEILNDFNGQSTCGPADTDFSGDVSIGELINFIIEWKAGNVLISDLIAAIIEWKGGC